MSDHNSTSPDGDQDNFADIEGVLSRLAPDDFERVAPPDDLWSAVSSALHADTAAQPETLPLARPMRARWSWRASSLVAAAAAVVIAILAVAVTQFGGDNQPSDVIASAKLLYDATTFDPLGAGTSGSASLVTSGAGSFIRIDQAVLPTDLPAGDDLEVWLLATDPAGAVVDLVALGMLDSGTVRGVSLAVPAGFDPQRYSVVDISIEPRDGNPAHSGRSILRGPLIA